MKNVLICLTMIIISQCIDISNYHIVFLKYILYFLNYTSLNLEKCKKKYETKVLSDTDI